MTTIQTILARDIDTENIDIRYDRSVKRVLSNTPLLAPITKYTVRELKNYSIPMIEKCIDADSIQVSQVFVNRDSPTGKSSMTSWKAKFPVKAVLSLTYALPSPCPMAAGQKSSSTSRPSRKAIPATVS